MNERIKELAEQAGLKWKAQPPHYSNTNNPIDFPVSANRDLEKFAELIVRECIEVVDDMADPEDSDRYFWAIQAVSQNIKKHFGVEE
jgi:hypothetical protein